MVTRYAYSWCCVVSFFYFWLGPWQLFLWFRVLIAMQDGKMANAPAPLRPKIFWISCSFLEILQNRMLAPWRVGASSYIRDPGSALERTLPPELEFWVYPTFPKFSNVWMNLVLHGLIFFRSCGKNSQHFQQKTVFKPNKITFMSH